MQLRIDKFVRLGGLAGVMAFAACSTLRSVEPVISPPSAFQLDRLVLVEFVGSQVVGLRCAQRGVRYFGLPGISSGACGSHDLITLPDPCDVEDDIYAQALCARIAGDDLGRREPIAVDFVHPELAVGRCRSRGETGLLGVVACNALQSMVVTNPCLADVAGWYSATACHELAHANGWKADHAGGSYEPQPAFVKRRLKPEDVLPPEAVRVALLAKAGKPE